MKKIKYSNKYRYLSQKYKTILFIQENNLKENKIVSPYTIKRKDNSTKYTILYIAAIVVLIMLVIIIIKYITDKDDNKLNYNNYITERSII